MILHVQTAVNAQAAIVTLAHVSIEPVILLHLLVVVLILKSAQHKEFVIIPVSLTALALLVANVRALVALVILIIMESITVT